MTWAKELQNNVTGAAGLREYRSLSIEEEKRLETILRKYPMRATRYYLSLVNWDDYENDPIYRLCVPTVLEEDNSGSLDTSGESTNTRLPGLQHKYRETVLVLTTHECAMYCRHCFRKRLVGLGEAVEKAADPKAAASYIRSHPEVSNVLLSGGDSFLLSNQTISEYLSLLTEIPHLDFIRFGTRVPVTFPMRITDAPELLSILKTYGRKKQIFIVTHFNHPGEITRESIKAVRLLREAGVTVRNQTVLLRGVNDNPEILSDLLGRLTGIGVLPYYIFQCRPVKGVKSQFQVPLKEAFRIVEEARGRMNGQAKNFRFVMSHHSGKIEVLGPSPEDGRMIFKYNQAKDRADLGSIFFLDLEEDRTWLD